MLITFNQFKEDSISFEEYFILSILQYNFGTLFKGFINKLDYFLLQHEKIFLKIIKLMKI